MTLQLDARQRAMLAEMKIPVWWLRPQAEISRGSASMEIPATAPTPASALPAVPAVPAVPALPEAAAQPSASTPAVAAVGRSAVDGMDWPALRDTVSVCTACALCEGRKAPVFANDPLPGQADWLIVGEPPDEEEERAGMPFVGAVGQLLDHMLRAVQCARDGRGAAGARVTSVVKCRPGALRNPNADELAHCAVYLRREIALTQPRVIVAMGRFAALSLLATEHPSVLHTPLGQLRGTVYRSRGVPVVVTYHPSKLLRAPLEKAAAWADLCLARAQVLLPPPPLP